MELPSVILSTNKAFFKKILAYRERGVNVADYFDFLSHEKEKEEQQQVKWQEVKNEWVQTLEAFMNDIRKWLSKQEEDGVVQIKREEIEIREDHLGSYQAPQLRIFIGTSEVKIQPIGRLIIGAIGRIDITSFADSYIVLRSSDGGWKYRESLQKEYVPFNEKSFADILKGMLYEN